mmetsp:Transcript_38963/g.115880  ORF Transcript_38963/g.115880 Transcript_38963/m.115880 type:complete len:308 (+) Transcript_38963:96-1019(+)
MVRDPLIQPVTHPPIPSHPSTIIHSSGTPVHPPTCTPTCPPAIVCLFLEGRGGGRPAGPRLRLMQTAGGNPSDACTAHLLCDRRESPKHCVHRMHLPTRHPPVSDRVPPVVPPVTAHSSLCVRNRAPVAARCLCHCAALRRADVGGHPGGKAARVAGRHHAGILGVQHDPGGRGGAGGRQRHPAKCRTPPRVLRQVPQRHPRPQWATPGRRLPHIAGPRHCAGAADLHVRQKVPPVRVPRHGERHPHQGRRVAACGLRFYPAAAQGHQGAGRHAHDRRVQRRPASRRRHRCRLGGLAQRCSRGRPSD